jgi:hypothetical protein
MKPVLLALGLALVAPGTAAAQPAAGLREVRFSGPSARDALCACLLELQRSAEADGRIDFTAEVASAGTGDSVELTARIQTGSAHAIGRINFTGHTGINDSTLRRAMKIYERDHLDVRQLRRGLARINEIGVFEPLTIPLRARKPRWWSLSGPIIPGIGMLQASVASRLPPWGRGVVEMATYFISLNVTGFAKPFLMLQRPVIPGQEILSGFAISPALSPRSMLRHYGLTHATHVVGPLLDAKRDDPLAVQVASGQADAEPLICVPPQPRLWWLRRGASVAGKIALGALVP